MVLYAQPIADCLRAVQKEVQEQGRPAPHIVFLTAGGQRYTEEYARRLAQYDNLTLVCGHYEGIDERVIDAFADEEISIGDYILTGGELASLVVADSVLRLKPGVWPSRRATRRRATGTACWSTPSTPGPRSGRPCCTACPAGGQPPEDRCLAGTAEPGAHPSAPPGAVRAVVHEPPHCRSAQVEAGRECPAGKDR